MWIYIELVDSETHILCETNQLPSHRKGAGLLGEFTVSARVEWPQWWSCWHSNVLWDCHFFPFCPSSFVCVIECVFVLVCVWVFSTGPSRGRDWNVYHHPAPLLGIAHRTSESLVANGLWMCRKDTTRCGKIPGFLSFHPHTHTARPPCTFLSRRKVPPHSRQGGKTTEISLTCCPGVSRSARVI